MGTRGGRGGRGGLGWEWMWGMLEFGEGEGYPCSEGFWVEGVGGLVFGGFGVERGEEGFGEIEFAHVDGPGFRLLLEVDLQEWN